jgi:UPF0755 protein
MKKALVVIAVVAGVIILSVTGTFIYYINSLSPVNTANSDPVYVTIEEGSLLPDISETLEEAGVISSSFTYEIYVKSSGDADSLQAGTYELTSGMSAEEITKKIVNGEVYDSSVLVTFFEGSSLNDMAEAIAETGIITAEEFIEEAEKVEEYQAEYSILDSIVLTEERQDLEGYLFPDTYAVEEDATASDLVHQMLDRFTEIYNDEYLARTEEMDKTVDEIVIMASIVEYEGQYEDDRNMIAGVFYNRIELGMPLQSDATLNYALGVDDPILTTEQTQYETGYNTYLNTGLPIGPIGSFGKISLVAALYPTESDYLYFLADINDGKVYFAETYAEHLENVNKYLD